MTTRYFHDEASKIVWSVIVNVERSKGMIRVSANIWRTSQTSKEVNGKPVHTTHQPAGQDYDHDLDNEESSERRFFDALSSDITTHEEIDALKYAELKKLYDP